LPTITTDVTPEVAEALSRQARALLLTRRMYVRAVLAAVAAQVKRDAPAVLRETGRPS
jgi:hypothetical protein